MAKDAIPTDTPATGVIPFSQPSKWASISLCFLGIALYRTWIEIAIFGQATPAIDFGFVRDMLFDCMKAMTMLVFVVAFRRTGPLAYRKSAYVVTAVLFCLSTGGFFASVFNPSLIPFVAAPSTACGGIAMGLLMMLWFELYACLTPFKAVLYFAASQVCSACLTYLFKGLYLPWLSVLTFILPLASLVLIVVSFKTLPTCELPPLNPVSVTPPWRLIALTSIYGFAFGLREFTLNNATFGSGAYGSPGTIIVALIVFVGVARFRDIFNLSMVYQIVLPIAIAAFLLLPTEDYLLCEISKFFATFTLTLLDVLSTLVIVGLCFRYRASALYLFGLERGLCYLSVFFGNLLWILLQKFGANATDIQVFTSVVTATLIVLTMLVMFDQSLLGKWGTSVSHEERKSAECAIDDPCHSLAKTHGLTSREEELLGLLVRGETYKEIETDLFLTTNTVKTHVKNIYRKTNVHSREELIALLTPDSK